jgi:hypothetical protein
MPPGYGGRYANKAMPAVVDRWPAGWQSAGAKIRRRKLMRSDVRPRGLLRRAGAVRKY